MTNENNKPQEKPTCGKYGQIGKRKKMLTAETNKVVGGIILQRQSSPAETKKVAGGIIVQNPSNHSQ